MSFDTPGGKCLDHLGALLGSYRFPVVIRKYGEEGEDWVSGSFDVDRESSADGIDLHGMHPDSEKVLSLDMLDIMDPDRNGGVPRIRDLFVSIYPGNTLSPHSISNQEHDNVERLMEDIGPGDLVLSFIEAGSADPVAPASFFSHQVIERDGFSICYVLNKGRISSYSMLEKLNREYQKLTLHFHGIVAIPPRITNYGRYIDIARSIRHLSEMVFCPGMVNLDHADLSILSRGGNVLVITIGSAQPGGIAAATSVDDALINPMCDIELGNIRKAIVNVVGNEKMTLEDSLVAAEVLKKRIKGDARIIWGVTLGEDHDDEMEVFIILATTPVELLTHWYSME